jgi:hypothetical protein
MLKKARLGLLTEMAMFRKVREVEEAKDSGSGAAAAAAGGTAGEAAPAGGGGRDMPVEAMKQVSKAARLATFVEVERRRQSNEAMRMTLP